MAVGDMVLDGVLHTNVGVDKRGRQMASMRDKPRRRGADVRRTRAPARIAHEVPQAARSSCGRAQAEEGLGAAPTASEDDRQEMYAGITYNDYLEFIQSSLPAEVDQRAARHVLQARPDRLRPPRHRDRPGLRRRRDVQRQLVDGRRALRHDVADVARRDPQHHQHGGRRWHRRSRRSSIASPAGPAPTSTTAKARSSTPGETGIEDWHNTKNGAA